MSIKRFPFYLRISPQTPIKTTKTHPYLSHTIYSSFFFPEETDYRTLSCISPCDTVLLSVSQTVKGSILNKKLISKDDLYQYHLNHQAYTKPIQFSFVFNELISNKFLFQKISEQNQSSSNQNVFIFGKKKTTFISKILIEIFKLMNEMKLSLYSFDYIKKEKRIVKDTIKDITIKSVYDIKTALKNMKKEYQLSKVNTDDDNEDNKNDIYRESLIITASYGKVTLNFITMVIEDNNLNDAQTLLKSGFDYLTTFILNITDHSVESTEEIKKFHYLYTNQDALIKLPLVKLLINNTSASNILNSFPNLQSSKSSKYSNRVLSPIPMSRSNDNNNDDLNDSMLLEDQPYEKNVLQTPLITHAIPSPNEMAFLEQENTILEKLNKKLEKSLAAEKKEKTNLLNELKEIKKKNIALQKDLNIKNDQINDLTSDKSALEKENDDLNGKYNNLSIAYNKNQLDYTKLNRKQELNFVDIEEKVSNFEAQLLSFQKENASLIQKNKKQSQEISTLTKEKEILYSKYKSSKVQIDKLSNKLNQIESDFIRLSAYSSQGHQQNSIDSSDECVQNDKLNNKSQRDCLIENLRNKITKYNSIK